MSEQEFDPKQPLPDLSAFFKMRRGLLRRERIAVSVYALSEAGCVIKTDEAFSPGDEIRIVLSLDMPFDNPTTPALLGSVRGGRKYCSNFFYRIDFSENNKESAFAGIRRILDLLERKVALTHRRKSGSRIRETVKSAMGVSGAGRLKRAGNGSTA